MVIFVDSWIKFWQHVNQNINTGLANSKGRNIYTYTDTPWWPCFLTDLFQRWDLNTQNPLTDFGNYKVSCGVLMLNMEHFQSSPLSTSLSGRNIWQSEQSSGNWFAVSMHNCFGKLLLCSDAHLRSLSSWPRESLKMHMENRPREFLLWTATFVSTPLLAHQFGRKILTLAWQWMTHWLPPDVAVVKPFHLSLSIGRYLVVGLHRTPSLTLTLVGDLL